MSNPTDNRQMSLMEEFEKAYTDAWSGGGEISRFSTKSYPAIALWSARWAFERASIFIDSPDFYTGPRERRADRIRQLAKELL